MVLKSEFIARQVLENRVSRAFLRAVPGLEDYSMLGKTWFHTTEEAEDRHARFDLVILDGPATGHLVSLLRIPDAILEAVPEGPLTKPAQATRALLRDGARARMMIVTLAEDLPVTEAVELHRAATDLLKINVGPVVVNALYPPRFSQGVSERALLALRDERDGALAPLFGAARSARRRRELNDRALERLTAQLPVRQAYLPYLFRGDFGLEAVEELSKGLDPQLKAV
jgi:hypothetical protein